jgi:hypothetical protein
MLRRAQISLPLAILIAFLSGGKLLPAFGQDQPFIQEIFARARVFPEIGPGVLAIKRDSGGRYFVLALPASAIAIYSADGNRAGQIPNAKSVAAKIIYAEDFDLDENGRLYVADRGANAVKIYGPDGTFIGAITIAAPASVVALSGGECAVISLRSSHLVDIFDANKEPVRSFGELSDLGDQGDNNRFTQRGRLSTDPAGHIYFAFAYLPVPAIRKYDRFGFAAYEVPLLSPGLSARAPEDQRGLILMEKRGDVPESKPVIDAIAVDPANQEIWAAIGDDLMHLDKDGNRVADYRTVTNDGVRIEPSAILVESDRILLVSSRLGVFDFSRPSSRSQGSGAQH